MLVLIAAGLWITSIAPSAASAATVDTSCEEGPNFDLIQQVLYTAGPGENNVLTATNNGSSITVTDNGSNSSGGAIAITAVSPADTSCAALVGAGSCTASGTNSATCTLPLTPGDPNNPYGLPPQSRVNADLGDLNDSTPGFNTDRNVSLFAFGGTGDDSLRGGIGSDYLQGDCHRDNSACFAGNDTFDGGPNPPGELVADDFRGINGFDTVTYADRTKPVEVQLPIAILNNAGGEIDANGNQAEGDRLQSLESAIGGSGDDILLGSTTTNSFDGGPGADTIDGGPGVDTADYSGRTAAVHVTVGNDQADDGEANEHDNVVGDVEEVLGGDGNDTLIGCDPSFNADPEADVTGRNILDGGPGDDVLDGAGGPDYLIGGDGNDTVDYSGRSEPIHVTIDQVPDDGGESDFEPTSRRFDTVFPDVETVIGGSGNDVLTGDANPNALDGGLGNDKIDGGGGDDELLGFDGNDSIAGGSGDDSVSGEAGNDSLDGEAGNDALDGGPDDDSLVGGTGADSIGGGDGTDLVDYSAALTPVSVSPNGAADDGTSGEGDNVGADVESATGGSDNDTLATNDGSGTLDGGAGDDVLDGGGGADTLIGGAGFDGASYAGRSAGVNVSLDGAANDGEAGEGDNVLTEKVAGGSGNDTLTGDGAANVLTAGGGNDVLTGGGSADLLVGGAGTDTLDGEDGADQLQGNEGNDLLNGGGSSDVLAGGDGDDSLDGGAAGDTLGGGAGDDAATYSARSKKVAVTLDGGTGNGETNEGDLIRTDVESVSTGSGDDVIDSRDGLAGRVRCGAGSDRVKPDSNDKVAADCEVTDVGASARCTISRRAVKMSKRGTIGIRVTCPLAAKGTLRVRAAKRSARKSLSVKAGKAKTVKVKLPRKARSLVKHRKRLSVRVSVSTRAADGRRQRATRTIRIKK